MKIITKNEEDCEMTVLSEQDKIRLLADIVKIQTENDHEIEVCEYLKDLLSQYEDRKSVVVGKECTSWCRSRWSPYH